ncbi:DUF624 domain-containing protein [Pseudalkalibacillus hwajinpoensis]|uniref:DUF624 domain-containing protein n=1 Tax=Guptibacillus hwajinpoensis TaxID=208199 RepID=UPI00325BB14E
MGEHKYKVFSYLEKIVDFLFLSFLWPSCASRSSLFSLQHAMFGVVRTWQLQKGDAGVFVTFFKLFKENFKQSFGLSLIWSLVGLSLYINFQILSLSGSMIEVVIFIVSVLLSIIYILITIYLFPMMVHVKARWHLLVRNSFFLVVASPYLTIVIGVVTLATVYFLLDNPAGLFFITSILAYFISFWFLKAISKLQIN